jgi:DNA-binding transcriptional LysR family regulator
VEFRQLTYFVAVAEELHFRRAAERCYVAQPAVSEQVRKLECEIGARLLDRTQHSVSLTEAGAAMLDEARRVLAQADVARAVARAAWDRATTRLRVGYAAAALLPGVARALQTVAACPSGPHTTLESGSPAQLIAALGDDRLDAAVVPLPAPVEGLRVVRLADQRVMAAVRAGHSHATRAAIDLRSLAPEQILVMPRESSRPLYDAVLATCHAAQVSPRLVELPAGEFEHALLAVASGRDVALLPESVSARYTAPGVRFLPLDGLQPAIATGVVTRHDLDHRPTTTFLKALARTARTVPPPAGVLPGVAAAA